LVDTDRVRGLALVVVAACGRIGFDAHPTGDGGGSSDGGTGTPCGGPTAISDNFDDGIQDPTWNLFTKPGMTVSETGGELVITLGDNVAGQNYAGYFGQRYMDMRGSRAFIEVTQTAVPTGMGEAAFLLRADAMNDVGIGIAHGTIGAGLRIAGVETTVMRIPYDPIAHRWIQLREDAGTVYYETSPDGTTFTAFANAPTPSYASGVTMQIYAGTPAAEPTPGAVHFDNLNGGGVPLTPWCKASTFKDSFDAGVVGTEWARSSTSANCTIAETGGEGVIVLDITTANECAFVTGSDYDLTSSSAFVAVKTTPNTATPTFSFIAVSIDNGAEVFTLGQDMTDIVCTENIATSSVERCRTPFIASMQSFWRLREQAGSLVWEIGPDGVTWTQMASVPYTFSFADVVIELAAGANSAISNPGTAVFDSYNE
jgi:hypothetical protein